MYKNLFFDFDDTLWDTYANSRIAMESLFGGSILSSIYDSFDDWFTPYLEYNELLWEAYQHGKIEKDQLIIDRFLLPLKRKGVDDIEVARELHRRYLDTVSEQRAIIPYSIELLEYLRPKYKLYILSNGFIEVQYRKIENAGMLGFFDDIILSEHAGVNKPHPDIFTYALTRTASAKHESLMIGDNFDTDISGAYKVGMDQMFYNRKGQTNLSFSPTFEVFGLDEIPGIL